jgi:serine/threonine protein kinase
METRWGRRFGRYEVIAEVGRGAMGVVYKARDPKIDRFVAVKTISLSGQNPAEEREYRERFFHEAQAAGRLLHWRVYTDGKMLPPPFSLAASETNWAPWGSSKWGF